MVKFKQLSTPILTEIRVEIHKHLNLSPSLPYEKVCDFMQIGSDDTYSILLLGGGGLAALYLAISIISAIDSVPLVRISCHTLDL